MRIPNLCLPGHAGAELVNLPMSLSGVGLQQPVVLQRPWGNQEGTAVGSRTQQVKPERGEGGREEGRGSAVMLQE